MAVVSCEINPSEHCFTVPIEGHPPVVASLLRRFPNTAFGIALGFAGQSILWRNLDTTPFSHDALGDAAHIISWLMWVAGIAALALATLIYLLKMAYHLDVTLAEFHHPVRCHFSNGPHVTMLMLTLGTPEPAINDDVRRVAFVVCAVLQVGLSITFYSRWLFSQTAQFELLLDYQVPQTS